MQPNRTGAFKQVIWLALAALSLGLIVCWAAIKEPEASTSPSTREASAPVDPRTDESLSRGIPFKKGDSLFLSPQQRFVLVPREAWDGSTPLDAECVSAGYQYRVHIKGFKGPQCLIIYRSPDGGADLYTAPGQSPVDPFTEAVRPGSVPITPQEYVRLLQGKSAGELTQLGPI